ncbi:MAG: RnfABCDGE type electron transport complex subunit B [Bacteroidales bacterium]|jgi:Na+-translocating ferredoxin:NAD+ oxidoreductase RNF subunit RnfB|nr:RnfABCDGE type electron transport complex subunit B [Bacteroidales bacterium]MCI2122477.1 RnfABCDGE type electron transport complex subunit B [Bacteroidales bacterium]MCI2146257.1 RnfABCDGE type electron transport complex subunit B [Bacteroidales bacterium]
MNTVLITIASLTLMGFILAVVLYFVAQKFKVEEDPRIDDVEALMPGANCGGCGHAGCRSFAESVVKAPSIGNEFCPVGGNAVMKKVAAYLGQTVEEKKPEVAVVRCNGSFDNRERANYYDGYSSCKVMLSLYTGDTGCNFGCAGLGDCVDACKFDAIHMNSITGLPEVDDEKCTGCGSCVKACPQNLIELRSKGIKDRRVVVLCRNTDKGAVTRQVCRAGCIGCGRCVKVCPFEAITLENNLAYIDPEKCRLCRKCVEVCPTGAIHAFNFPPRVPVEVTMADALPLKND